jgi:N-acetylmuramoyl-L-alanine amidase
MYYGKQRILDIFIIVMIVSYAFLIKFSITYDNNVKEIKPIETHNLRTVGISSKIISMEPRPLEVVKPVHNVKDNEDFKVLAHIINAEAKDQPYEGKIAVGNVIMNRVDSPKFPDTIKEVVYQKGQFQPVSNGAINKKPSDESIRAAKEVLEGRREVNENVLFFYNPEISTSSWIFTREVVTKIGEHAFAI